MQLSVLDSAALLNWARASVEGLITRSDEINRLNVFPVADADTGTNMLFTMRSAVNAAEALGDGATVAQVAAALARGAVHGARGNSGVILSQIVRGIADAAADQDAIGAEVLRRALRQASQFVIASMSTPVEGTIVSVLAAAAQAADRVADGVCADDLVGLVSTAADAAVAALEKTPKQLDILADNGVVDAGARGLVVILDALVSVVAGELPTRREYSPSPPKNAPSQVWVAGPGRGSGGLNLDPPRELPPEFEVMYLLSGCDELQIADLRTQLDGMGDSIAIAGDGDMGYSVHAHVNDAGAAIEAGMKFGTPQSIQISSLRGDVGGGHHDGRHRHRRVLALAEGDGAATLFSSEGAQVLRVDEPPASAKRLLDAVVDSGAHQIMVLPNGLMAAEELVAVCAAARGWGITVIPLPSASMAQGLAALAVHDPERIAVDDSYTMARAAGATRFGLVRVATERALTWSGTCEPGDAMGIIGDEVLVLNHEVANATKALVSIMLSSGGELVTILLSDQVDESLAEALIEHTRSHHGGVEVMIYRTGQHTDVVHIGVE
ncbi:putative dihydroxyacetone kinase [Mycolicibacterium phlei]|uniref:DAK2 domain-containing protein n=1 Tax=Mycobacteroides chelonae TaxID=1774 RepID=UPI000618D59E|nr:DAK2 domain-containing protein [Mycobacteroides chelonae]VEG18456.1 putative dihydroxyacetone kinase [Mycolicibacterium phlei]AKC39703.1 dihydroxyacetone kinase [Mycobacteroides chelonae]ANA99233.1 dihydroxyacetone kinase [Mycobacteroides chelonae CCUG 47445]OLT72923.1 dihydroxyacetone kinase [Mycobacteroides chelonae]ORV12251.1 dihydroxyacetone kinase [Mycobacteroides chelonae]